MMHSVRQVDRILADAGCRLETCVTQRAGHATELARRHAESSDALLIVGGDGTIREAAQGVMDLGVPMLAWGTGTENLLARGLGMPTRPDSIARSLLWARPIPFDVGVLNGQSFLVVAGVGFDAECVMRLTAIRTGHITHWSYFWPIWRTYWGYGFPDLQVEVDGVRVFDGTGFAVLSNIPRNAAGLTLMPSARSDDGRLDVCIFPCSRRVGLLGHAFRAFMNRHIGRGGTIYCQAEHIAITSSSRQVPIQVDGDVGGVLPAECVVHPAALALLAGEIMTEEKKHQKTDPNA